MTIQGERVFLDLGSCAHPRGVRRLGNQTNDACRGARARSLAQAIDCARGGYVGLELSQAFRRFGSNVTVIEHGPQLASHEDRDVGAARKDLFADEGIESRWGPGSPDRGTFRRSRSRIPE
jgi:pyruvate/2-oxoglutarate dehydrogenase complex dihydrolipoamide dehydrogenase (E3) component